MGVIITARKFSPQNQAGLLKPIIFCCPYEGITAKFPEGVVLKDFDVLFNPDYKIDVLKIMVNTCKAKPFSIIWPGSIEGNRLIYAEEGFRDYKTYDVNDYDITCIV